jgi:hypothetical protein
MFDILDVQINFLSFISAMISNFYRVRLSQEIDFEVYEQEINLYTQYLYTSAKGRDGFILNVRVI